MLSGLALATVAAPAGAEEVFTSQATAAHATDSTWIPAPARPAAVCIVDTGNDENPDTSNVIARLATDGGDGHDLDTVGHHGTLMSMIASAPYNGFGMVGIAPSVKVVSVRATRDGGGFTLGDLLAGVQACVNSRQTYNIKVVSLSLGMSADNTDAVAFQPLVDAVNVAHRYGLNVVAASGNRGPGHVDYPAAYGPVLAVGGTDAVGTACPFSATLPAVDAAAPGCRLDVALPGGQPAWASGTSESTALVSAVLAQLRGLRPSLTWSDAEARLLRSLTTSGSIDVDRTIRNEGLAAELASGAGERPRLAQPTGVDVVAGPLGEQNAAAPPPSPVPGSNEARTSGRPAVLPRPRVRSVRSAKGRLTLLAVNRPRGVSAEIIMFSVRPGDELPRRWRAERLRQDRIRVRVLGKLREVSIRYVDAGQPRLASAPLTLRFD